MPAPIRITPATRWIMLRSFSPMPSTSAIQELGNLSAKPVITRTMKLVSRIRCCQRWLVRHARHAWDSASRRATGLAPPDDGVVQEHGADHGKNQHQINPSHPAHGNRTDVLDALPSMCTLVRVNFCVTPLWHWPQVASRLALVDGGAGIAGGQNVMHAVATGAVGRHHRAALRGQPVITVQVTGSRGFRARRTPARAARPRGSARRWSAR